MKIQGKTTITLLEMTMLKKINGFATLSSEKLETVLKHIKNHVEKNPIKDNQGNPLQQDENVHGKLADESTRRDFYFYGEKSNSKVLLSKHYIPADSRKKVTEQCIVSAIKHLEKTIPSFRFNEKKLRYPGEVEFDNFYQLIGNSRLKSADPALIFENSSRPKDGVVILGVMAHRLEVGITSLRIAELLDTAEQVLPLDSSSGEGSDNSLRQLAEICQKELHPPVNRNDFYDSNSSTESINEQSSYEEESNKNLDDDPYADLPDDYFKESNEEGYHLAKMREELGFLQKENEQLSNDIEVLTKKRKKELWDRICLFSSRNKTLEEEISQEEEKIKRFK